MAVLEELLADVRAQSAKLADLKECKWCVAMETSEERAVCDREFTRA